MNTLDIFKHLSSDEHSNFCGVKAMNQLPNKMLYPCGFEVNTDNKKRQGSTGLPFIFMNEIKQYFLIRWDFHQNIINFKGTSRSIPKNMNGTISKF